MEVSLNFIQLHKVIQALLSFVQLVAVLVDMVVLPVKLVVQLVVALHPLVQL